MRNMTAMKLLAVIFGVSALALFATGRTRYGGGAVVLALLIGAIFAGAWWFRDRPRADSHRHEARRLRLRYAFGDPHGLLSLPHPLLHRIAQMRGLEHVSWGTWNGLPVEVFEYWYTVPSDPGVMGDRYERFTCVLTPVPASWPDLTVEPTRLATTVASAVTSNDLRTESDAFNRSFHMTSSDPAFASAVIDARMIEWLMTLDPSYGFQIVGGRLLAFTERVDPWRTEEVLGVTGGFLAQVPGAARSLYP